MSEAQKLPARNEVAPDLTWDLTKIFPDEQAFHTAYETLTEQLKQAPTLKGTLGNSAAAFLKGINYYLDVYRQAEIIYVYAHLKNDQDTTNTTYQALYARANALIAQVSEAVAWFEPEILTLSDEQVWSFFDAEADLAVYRHFIEDIMDGRPHVLSQDQ